MLARWPRTSAAGLALLIFSAGCGKHEPPAPAPAPAPAPKLKPAPPTPIDIKREELGGPTWKPAWDKIVEESLPPEMLSARAAHDVRGLCPRFGEISKADKRAFWAYFFQALAAAEGGLKPTARALHSQPAMQVRDEVTHRQVRTEGLLQLAYEDEKRYGCDFDYATDRKLPADDPERTILRPKNNLQCGIRILSHELFVEHRPLLSRTEYWSTLQPGTFSYHVFAKQMANVPKACRVHQRRVRRRRRRRMETASARKP